MRFIAPLVLTLAAFGLALPTTSEAQSCHAIEGATSSVLATGRIVDHERIRERMGKTMHRLTKGHRIRFVAEEGQSVAFFERLVRCQRAAGTLLPGQDLDLEDLELSVRRSGPYFELEMKLDSTTQARALGDRLERVLGDNSHYAARQTQRTRN